MGGIEVAEAPAEAAPRSYGMEGIREVLEAARDQGLLTGRFRGLLHIAIGRRITRTNGTVVSSGVTWRELAPILKELRFDRDLVREFGTDPDALAPRDRERFWYTAIAQARVDSVEASNEADALAAELKRLGFHVGPNPALITKSGMKSERPPAKGKKK
jgi:hypothetical protein